MFNTLIRFLLYLTIVLFSFGQLGRISFFGQQANIYLYDVTVFIILIALLTRYKILPFSRLPKLNIILFSGIYLLLSFFINWFSYSLFENIVSFLYIVRLVVYALFFIYCYHWAKKQQIIGRLLILYSLITILTAIVQYFFYTDLRNLYYLGWDPHYYRLFGLFFDTSIAGGIYGLLFLYSFFSISKLNKQYTLQIILAVLFFMALLLTFSRGVYLAFLVNLLVFSIYKRAYKLLLVGIGALIIGFILLPKPFGEGVNILRSSTISSRMQDYETALSLYLKHPIFGVGYNHLRYAKLEVQSKTDQFEVSHAGASFHSSFMIILVTTGIIGFAGFIYILYLLSRINFYTAQIIIFLSAYSLTDNILLHPFIVLLSGFIFIILIRPSDIVQSKS